MPRFYLTTPPQSVSYVLNLLCYLCSEPAPGKIVSCELAAPQSLSLGKTVPTELVASAISLKLEDIVTDTHHPQICSVGLPFVFTELRDRAVLERAPHQYKRIRCTARSGGQPPTVFVYQGERRL